MQVLLSKHSARIFRSKQEALDVAKQFKIPGEVWHRRYEHSKPYVKTRVVCLPKSDWPGSYNRYYVAFLNEQNKEVAYAGYIRGVFI